MDITRHFEEDPTILLPTTNLLNSLFQDNINLEKAYYYDIVSICTNSLHKYSSTQDVCVSVLNILVVVCGIESCAFQLLADESYRLIILLEYMKKGISHLSIAEQIISLLQVLFKFKDLKEELFSLELKDILSDSFGESPFPILNEFIQSLEITN